MRSRASLFLRRVLLGVVVGFAGSGLIALACTSGSGCSSDPQACAAREFTVAEVQAANPGIPNACNTDSDCMIRSDGIPFPCGCFAGDKTERAVTTALAAKFDEMASADCTGCPLAACDAGAYPGTLTSACVGGRCTLVEAGCDPPFCFVDAGPDGSDAGDGGDSGDGG